MQAALGLALLGACFLLVRYASPDAEGRFPPIMRAWGAATGAALAFTILAALGALLVAFWFMGIGVATGPV